VDIDGILEGLTDTQRHAVTTQSAPLCIRAGAGAGKTRVLTARIAHRVATGSADPGHVLALTFTRKAAGELTDRLRRLGLRDAVTTGTFHAVAYAQLRQHWRDRGELPPTILDRKARLIATLAAGRHGIEGAAVADLAAEIEWAQARTIEPEGYAPAVEAHGRRPPVPAPAMAALYERYQLEKRRRRLADFDDLLARCSAALEQDPTFAASQRWRWRHLFVDEFQDVNPLQHRLLDAWLGPRVDLCVVGDPNQAIYTWNGADPRLLSSFSTRWPGGEVVELDANHRSTPQVVAAAAAVLPPGARRPSSTRPDGPSPRVRAFDTDRDEARGVAAELRRAHAEGLAWSQLAVLMRTNVQAVAFDEALRAAGIPLRIAAGDAVLDHPAVRRAVAGLRRQPGAPFAMVVADLDAAATSADPDAAPGPVAHEDAEALAGLAALARAYRQMDQQPTTEGFIAWLQATTGAERPDRGVDAVTVCSFHRAKGLEWPAVWVTGLERGLVPIGRAITPEAVEEERRLVYVALTRAERELHCSWAEHRRFAGRAVPRDPSPWLEAIVAAAIADEGSDDDIEAPRSWREHLAAERVALSHRGRRGRRDGTAGADPHVVAALQTWRATLARAAGVPPFVLLHDTTLRELAIRRPRSVDDLLAVPGIGPVKASRFGDELLGVVAAATARVPA